MRKAVFRNVVALFVLALSTLSWGLAHAQLVITPTFDASITGDPNAAVIENTINGAIAVYEARFADPINVAIKFQEGSGLGSSQSFFGNGPYSQYYAALKADATTNNDALALAHLPAGPNNSVTGDANINVKTANLRALGIPVFPTGGFDGIITLNTALTFPGSAKSSLQYSLMAVTEHEIDEVLGLGSALPNPPFNDPLPEDLFRYTANGQRTFTTNSSVKAYFSLDGTTLLDQFDNQNDGGDFGDWQSNPRPPGVAPQVQDAFATPFATPNLGVELTALDVIGYDLKPAPAPGCLGVLAGFLVTGAAFRCRHRTPR